MPHLLTSKWATCYLFFLSLASWNLLPPNLAAAHDWHDPILRFHDPKACKLWHSRLRPGKKCRKKNEWFVYFQPGLSYSSHKLWDSAIAWLNIAVANPILTSQTKRMKHFNEQNEVTFGLYRRLDYQVLFLRYNASRFFSRIVSQNDLVQQYLDDGFVDLCRPKRQMPSSLPALWVLVVLAAVGHRRVDLVCFFRKIDPYPRDERYTYQYLPWKIEQSNNSTRGKLYLAREI